MGTVKEDDEITSLLNRVFVEEGYTDKSNAKTMFVPAELQKRGDIILARSQEGNLLGMIIFVRSSSFLCQVAQDNEAEIQLLAVYPEDRSQGIASQLILACEQRAILSGCVKMVLSTQQSMKQAQSVYNRLGYRRNPIRDWSKDSGTTYLVYEKLLLDSCNR